ncbi:hypothetical protein CRUP_027605 [Coryphaenoides rupestris]|nr:hypothetical protein CRUP_027605 [Coryphaenoides rupestris]
MMFYTQLFTSKRGSLAKIWLAAHWDRKLTKAHVFDCNLESTVRDIISTKMKIGLRTSGHLLVGVVRIFSRKAKYLLADCSEARVKIRVSFRPGQIDLPLEDLEAPFKSITLSEDMTDFDTQPCSSELDAVDHFSLNQSRAEDITLKEDFVSDFLDLMDFGGESQCHTHGIVDRSLTYHGDSFGDENTGIDLLEEPQNEVPDTSEADWLRLTTLLDNEEEGFALEPVAVTPTTTRMMRRGKRKRRLLVDQSMQLSNKNIRDQLADTQDLSTPPDMAPPTAGLMRRQENGGAQTLLGRLCSPAIDSQLQQDNLSVLSTETVGLGDDPISPELTRMEDAKRTLNNTHGCSGTTGEDDVLEYSLPQLPSEDHDSVQSTSLATGPETAVHTQTTLGNQEEEEEEEKRMNSRVRKLHYKLQSLGTDSFSIQALCEGSSRANAAATFFCLLVLKKERVLEVRQDAPYGPITATPGPRFHQF